MRVALTLDWTGALGGLELFGASETVNSTVQYHKHNYTYTNTWLHAHTHTHTHTCPPSPGKVVSTKWSIFGSEGCGWS